MFRRGFGYRVRFGACRRRRVGRGFWGVRTIGIFWVWVIVSGMSAPRQSIYRAIARASAAAVGAYCTSMVHEILSLISPMFVHVVLGAIKPGISPDARTAVTVTGAVAATVIFID